ncbi:uncharacterized protein LOC131950164 isoform X2 [Physella acuta]|uniref:uncharacterized protein LOC131950164 isoform X2 n=1 Tax=Physella acuta TaxID=109671 RepID=UPI0027DD9346|nr:uncharacterized protein LOC131950164 isoform X2 [Physella acuta]
MSLPVCKFFNTNQTCRFGKYCKFSHSTADRPPSLKNSEIHHEELKQRVDHTGAASATDSVHNLTSDCSENEKLLNEEQVSSETSQTQQTPSNSGQNAGSSVNKRPTSRKICYFFSSQGYCRYGRFCNFSHAISKKDGQSNHDENKYDKTRQRKEIPPRFKKSEESNTVSKTENLTEEVENEEKDTLPTQNQAQDLKYPPKKAEENKRICRFFKSNRCWRGGKCRFEHPKTSHADEIAGGGTSVKDNEPVTSNEPEEETKNEGSQNKSKQSKPPPGKQIFTLLELERYSIDGLRDSEIQSIKKRFPKDKITVITDEEIFSAKVIFTPTDPDWPFDVKHYELLIKIPADYPKEMMHVELPTEQDLPETVRRYVDVSINEFLSLRKVQLRASNKVELLFRPFLRWLDRHIEDITTDALKQLKRELVARAAGLEFIPAEKLKARFQAVSESSDGNGDSQEDGDDASGDTSSEQEESSEYETSEEEDDENTNPTQNLDPDKKGTEVALRNLQLRENASALLLETLKLVLQCQRCKNHSELIVPHGRVMSLQCIKCNQKQFVNYRAALMHQFSSIAGYLDVDGCQAFDLIFQDSRAAVTCLACSKQTRINGLVTGQLIDGWCQACNARFKLASESVKFTQLVQSVIDTGSKVVEVTTSKAKKPPKDPAIREGYPLPEFGTCKHYKHSYRWLRFSCCGKVYPCDICHDKKEDHEMEIATRMICGHCCKEQNFAGMRPCSGCGQHMTKVRSAHWEGGTGCRDKIAMSTKDQQKYKNMNKTLSNHKKKVEKGATKKKTTKLRHS